MPHQIVPFKCQKCGECCRHLVGSRFGMALTPDEMARLRVFAHRHGIKFEPAPLARNIFGAVTLYQFTQEVCPFLDSRSNTCRCYAQRPTVCRMYPLFPGGTFPCAGMDRTIKALTCAGRKARIGYTEALDHAAKEYALTVKPLLDAAIWIYDLNRGWVTKQSITQVTEHVDYDGARRIV